MRDIRLPTEEESRIQWWRRVVVRRESTPIPLAEFCRQSGITTRRFYYWRQRLREFDAAGSGWRNVRPRSSQPASAVAADATAPFLPVSIIGRDAMTELVVELSNGCTVRLNGSVDAGLLQTAIAAAGQFGGCRQGGH
jgi:hypothetical protein